MSQVEVKTYYLEMVAPSGASVAPPREGVTVVHARKPTVAYYRFLYDSVGGAYHWTSRKKLSDAQLAALIHDPRMENHVLLVGGVPAGFAELDRRTEGEIELVQFGLIPEFVGQGLGRYRRSLLGRAAAQARRRPASAPRRSCAPRRLRTAPASRWPRRPCRRAGRPRWAG